MLRRNWPLLLTLLLMCGNVTSGEEPSLKDATGIEGIVTVSPTRPGPIRAGSENTSVAPLANAAFTIKSDTGTVTSFTTGADGRFHLLLPPGHYVVSLVQQRFMRPCGPFEVDVVSGKMTHLEWRCDTGMR